MAEENRHIEGIHQPDNTTGRLIKFHPEYLDDATLWKAFRNGDDAALITIFDLHVRSMYNYGCKIFDDKETVKDTIQDLFADLLQNRSGLGETNAIRFYLLKSLRRRLVKLKIKAKTLNFFDFDDSSPSQEFILISSQISEEQRQSLSVSIAQLSRKQQEAIFFRYHEDLSYEQITEVMRIRKQTVYNLINGAIKILRETLK